MKIIDIHRKTNVDKLYALLQEKLNPQFQHNDKATSALILKMQALSWKLTSRRFMKDIYSGLRYKRQSY